MALLSSARVGQSHGDTRAFDHVGELQLDATSHIKSITVVHENAIVGITVDYQTSHGLKKAKHVGNHAGPKSKATIDLAPDEYITHVSGRSGAFLDHIYIRTNKGQVIDVGGPGGSPFDLGIPEGHAVVGFQGGIGGHLHNVAAIYRPLYLWTAPVHTHHAGQTHGDTRPWDHLPGILSHGQISSFRVAEIHGLWGQYVVGFNVVYEINGQRFNEEHYGSDRSNSANHQASLVLDHDEHIIAVHGHSGALVDSIIIQTNKGKAVQFGGNDGTPYDLGVPQGKRVVGFAGGTNGHLHNVGVYFN